MLHIFHTCGATYLPNSRVLQSCHIHGATLLTMFALHIFCIYVATNFPSTWYNSYAIHLILHSSHVHSLHISCVHDATHLPWCYTLIHLLAIVVVLHVWRVLSTTFGMCRVLHICHFDSVTHLLCCWCYKHAIFGFNAFAMFTVLNLQLSGSW